MRLSKEDAMLLTRGIKGMPHIEVQNKETTMKKTYCFDDVLLTPRYSEIESRSEVSLRSHLKGEDFLELPIISSPMDTVTEINMCETMDQLGGLGVLHRYNTIAEQCQLVREMKKKNSRSRIAAAIGMTGDFFKRAVSLVDAGANILCLDVAHGHHRMMKRALEKLRSEFGEEIHLMAGNVATLEAFDDLASWGADSIRVGIGGGSICSTRIVTGHGIPTFQSVLECSNTSYDAKIIADGGIKNTGDMVKALAAGADFVMIGSMLSGTDETPGELLTSASGERFKEYRGMASKEAQRDWRGKSSTPEGVATLVPYKGPALDIIQDIDGGIRSGLSYTGVRDIKELQARGNFILQTNASQLESNTHILLKK